MHKDEGGLLDALIENVINAGQEMIPDHVEPWIGIALAALVAGVALWHARSTIVEYYGIVETSTNQSLSD